MCRGRGGGASSGKAWHVTNPPASLDGDRPGVERLEFEPTIVQSLDRAGETFSVLRSSSRSCRFARAAATPDRQGLPATSVASRAGPCQFSARLAADHTRAARNQRQPPPPCASISGVGFRRSPPRSVQTVAMSLADSTQNEDRRQGSTGGRGPAGAHAARFLSSTSRSRRRRNADRNAMAGNVELAYTSPPTGWIVVLQVVTICRCGGLRGPIQSSK